MPSILVKFGTEFAYRLSTISKLCGLTLRRARAELLFLHLVEVLKSAGAEQHEREEQAVVTGVDDYAGGQ